MLGNIYEVPVQLGMYHSFILSEYTVCCMCVWFQVHMQMMAKESPLNMMRQPFGTVACCGLVILQLAREIEVFGGNPTLLPLCTLQSHVDIPGIESVPLHREASDQPLELTAESQF